jgi:TolA-binding protein
MKSPTSPRRLRESEELGARLRRLDGESLSEERLARNAAMLEQKVAGIVAAAGVAAGAAGTAAAAGKAAAVSVMLKIGVPVVIAVAAAGTTYVALRPPEPRKAAHKTVVQPTQRQQRRVRSAVSSPDASVPDPDGASAVDATVPATTPAPRSRRPARRQAAPAPTPAPPVAVSAPATDTDTAAPVAPPASATPEPPPAPTVSPAPTAPPAAPSRLPDQIRLFEAAKRAGRARRYKKALGLIEELLRRFPTTPLAAEARLSQAELLMRAGRLRDATIAVRGLLTDPRHAGRRGELLRVLGELLRRQGDCRGAVVAYRQALAAPLSKRDARAARRGLAACKAGERSDE